MNTKSNGKYDYKTFDYDKPEGQDVLNFTEGENPAWVIAYCLLVQAAIHETHWSRYNLPVIEEFRISTRGCHIKCEGKTYRIEACK